jgi:long-chain acyl-CoA synthetase
MFKTHPNEIDVEKPWIDHYPDGVSYELGAMPWTNLREMCIETCRRYGSKTAFSVILPNGMNTDLSFNDVDRLSNAFAAYLRVELGLRPGERVALMLPNSLNYPVVSLGVFKAGLVLVNVNPLYTADELAHLLKDSGAALLVTMDLFLDRVDLVARAQPVPRIVVARMSDYFSVLPKLAIKTSLRLKKQVQTTSEPTVRMTEALSVGARLFRRANPWERGSWATAERPVVDGRVAIESDDLAVLQYTGGTTGVSKGAMLTQANIISNVMQIRQYARQKLCEGKETLLTALPLYHIFAFTCNMLLFFVEGAHDILIPSPRPISNLRVAFQKHGITWMSGVNTLYHALLEEKWFCENPPKHLRVCIGGGTAVQHVVAERWQQVVGVSIHEGYGLTEASPVCSFNRVDRPAIIGSIGLPIPRTVIAVLNGQQQPVSLGETGELAVCGPQVMRGYWNRPEETEKVLCGKWLLTGDIGRMDANGNFYVVDRKKDMILVSGFNVYPNEVEDVLMELADIKECAVIGVPADVRGEDVVAYVVSRSPGLQHEMVRQHCKERLAAYKVPRQMVFVNELPKTNVGKVLRRELKRLHMGAR